MTDFESDLTAAGDALRSLAEGPGVQAAEALEAAFGKAGQSIETALGQAARAGELVSSGVSEAWNGLRASRWTDRRGSARPRRLKTSCLFVALKP